MLCEKCGKYSATTHIQTVVNGVVSEKNLCSYCAATEGIHQNSLGNMLASMFGEVPNGRLQTARKCPVCGATFSEIAKNGKVGCAQCYKEFKTELLPYLKRVHGATKHIGKNPNSIVDFTFEKDTVLQLREELKRLVSEENYEQAAVIRDKLREIEGNNNE